MQRLKSLIPEREGSTPDQMQLRRDRTRRLRLRSVDKRQVHWPIRIQRNHNLSFGLIMGRVPFSQDPSSRDDLYFAWHQPLHAFLNLPFHQFSLAPHPKHHFRNSFNNHQNDSLLRHFCLFPSSFNFPLLFLSAILGQGFDAVSMAVSTSFSGAKLEALLLKSSSPASRASAAARLSDFGKPGAIKKTLIQRGIIRCEAAVPEVLIKADDPSNGNSVSALEQLKTSAADSKSCFSFSVKVAMIMFIAHFLLSPELTNLFSQFSCQITMFGGKLQLLGAFRFLI